MPANGPSNPYPPGLGQDWFAQHLFCRIEPSRPGFWLAMVVTVVLFCALLAGLQHLGSAARRRLTVVCTFLAGLFYLGAFFLAPGNKLSGSVVAGDQVYRVEGKVAWVTPKPPEEPKGKAAEPEAPPQRMLTARILLTPPVKGKAPEPKPDADFLSVSGVYGADGWQLTLETAGTKLPLKRERGGYSLAIRGQAALLTLRVQAAHNVVKAYETPLGQFMLVMGAFTIGLGLINLCAVHGRVLLRGQRGWHNSAAFFVGFLVTAVFGIWQMQLPETAKDAAMPWQRAVYEVMFSGLLKPLQSTTFALLGFFIVSAAYRAFRIRSTEAALMTIVAFAVMMGQVPLGQYLTAWIPADGPLAWLRIERITNWLLTTPNTAATRGILFGSVTGGFALSLRVWLSLERGSYFGKEF